jgi:hypothetical protein
LINKKTVTVLLIAFLLISTLSIARLETAKADTTITVSLNSSVIRPYVGSPITCYAWVSGDLPLTGNVTWSSNSSMGIFTSAAVQDYFSDKLFSVTFRELMDAYTPVTITATYGGDPNTPPCSGNTTITFRSFVNIHTQTLVIANNPVILTASLGSFDPFNPTINPTGTIS